jgi:hypothetical protein
MGRLFFSENWRIADCSFDMSRSRHSYRRYEGEKLYHLEKTLRKYRLKVPLDKVIEEQEAAAEEGAA